MDKIHEHLYHAANHLSATMINFVMFLLELLDHGVYQQATVFAHTVLHPPLGSSNHLSAAQLKIFIIIFATI